MLLRNQEDVFWKASINGFYSEFVDVLHNSLVKINFVVDDSVDKHVGNAFREYTHTEQKKYQKNSFHCVFLQIEWSFQGEERGIEIEYKIFWSGMNSNSKRNFSWWKQENIKKENANMIFENERIAIFSFWVLLIWKIPFYSFFKESRL